jgi:hypothetical protein
MRSDSFAGSVASVTAAMASSGMFFLILAYFSNSAPTERTRAVTTSSSPTLSSSRSARASKKRSFFRNSVIRTRALPSTSTFTVPSGSLRSCSTLASTPER